MRKSEIVRVPDGFGRDSEPKRKVFLITEWAAERAEKWAIRMLLAYNRGGGQMQVTETLGTGMEGIFFIGVQTFLRGQIQAAEIIPILDELLDCVKIIRDESKPDVATGKPVAHPLMPDDIEEVKTRLWLRSEVMRVHTNFSPAAAVSSLISAIMTAAASRNTRTSRSRSRSRSQEIGQA